MAKSMRNYGKGLSLFESYLVGDCIKSDVRTAIAQLKASAPDDKPKAREEVSRTLNRLTGYVYGLCAAYNNCECFEAAHYWSRYSDRLVKLLFKCLDY